MRSDCLKRLPRSEGQGRTTPHVGDLAREFLIRSNYTLEAAHLRDFVNTRQIERALTSDELAAVPLMLRLVLIEKLSALATVACQCESSQPQAMDGSQAEVRSGEAERPAIGKVITSLRALQFVDWKEFVESTNIVERVLCQDPAAVYSQMTFDSRNRYWQVVAGLARGSKLLEEQVAECAVQLALESQSTSVASPHAGIPSAPAERHVGHYLLGRGRPSLEKAIGYRLPLVDKVRRFIDRRAAAFYFGGLFCGWLLGLGIVGCLAWRLGVTAAGPVGCLVLLLLTAGGAAHFTVWLVDWLCSLFVAPQPMMRMDFGKGIPAEHRTLVAVPTMLTNDQGVSLLLHQLELRYLANRDDNLSFALVTDFPDANCETLPEDSALLDLARQGVERLNRRHHNAFYLLHRPRTWNAQEGVWMGHERKRGKLSALNGLLLRGDASAFQVTVGDLARLASVRYVITLDTDTRLPRDAGRELVGCMAHPLNRPQIDPHTRIVTVGHAVLQPKVTPTFVDAQRSPFARLFAGDAGIDPYTRHTSQVYQDLFDEGSFIGKGIYDVRAWETVMEGRFPANRVLSHDLIEGCLRGADSSTTWNCSKESHRKRWLTPADGIAGFAATGKLPPGCFPLHPRRPKIRRTTCHGSHAGRSPTICGGA